MLDHNRDQPDDPFEPYGATVGHGLEWSRLRSTCGPHSATRRRPRCSRARSPLRPGGSRRLGGRRRDGFVYTTDWDGTPVVRERMHWVLAEAVSAAAALWVRDGGARLRGLVPPWWDYAATYLVREDGSWQHELDGENRPAGTVWPGQPDLYHSVHAVLLQRLPLAPSAPVALAAGLLR